MLEKGAQCAPRDRSLAFFSQSSFRFDIDKLCYKENIPPELRCMLELQCRKNHIKYLSKLLPTLYTFFARSLSFSTALPQT
jgi:hypothetical protein